MSTNRIAGPRVSVIVISLKGKGRALECVRESGLQLIEDFETIVVSGVTNASKARNLGVAKAKGEIVLLMDDDVEFTKESIYHLLSFAQRGKIIGSEASRLMYRDDYIRAAGFDERVFIVYMEDIEFRRRAEKFGLIEYDEKTRKYIHIQYPGVIRHLGGKPSWRKLLLLKFNAPLVFLQYGNTKEFLKNLTAYPGIHPLRLLASVALLVGFFYYLVKLRFWRRSMFSTK